MRAKLRGHHKQELLLEEGKFCGVAAMVAAGSAAISLYNSNKQANAMKDANQAQIDINKVDPHVTNMLYGPDGTSGQGLIDKYRGLLDQPQDPRMTQYGNANMDYLGTAPQDMSTIRGAANSLIQGSDGTRINSPAWAHGSMIQAPSQNGVDLKGAYQDMIYGAPGANPYLTGAIQGGINQSQQGFDRMSTDLTSNLQKNILPGIRGGAVIAGGYGGSRQGIAEGNALSDYTKQMTRAETDFGQHNTDAAVGAQAGAYSDDRNRALQAMSGLGAQQYGVAQADADTKNRAEFGNVGQTLDVLKTNADLSQRGILSGSGLLSGQAGQAYGVGGNQDQFNITRAQGVNGLLNNYLAKNPVPTTLQPVYGSTAGSALAGGMAGMGLYNAYQNINKPQNNDMYGSAGQGMMSGAGSGFGSAYNFGG